MPGALPASARGKAVGKAVGPGRVHRRARNSGYISDGLGTVSITITEDWKWRAYVVRDDGWRPVDVPVRLLAGLLATPYPLRSWPAGSPARPARDAPACFVMPSRLLGCKGYGDGGGGLDTVPVEAVQPVSSRS
ncbi:hypothetical protein VTN02DRAFT_3447 [Thermoascus thermophilus]